MLTRTQLADYLQVTERTIDRYRERGMPHYKLPTGTIRFEIDEVITWMKDYGKDYGKECEGSDR